MKKINIEHVYNLYPLYQIIYGRDKVSKHIESHATVCFIERYLEKFNRGLLNPVNILEVFSGKSEHKRYIEDEATFPIGNYYLNDLYAPPNDSNTLVGDALTTDFNVKVDIILALYLTGVTVLDSNYLPTRSAMVSFIRNMYNNLKEGDSAFILDCVDDGYEVAINDLVEEDCNKKIYIPYKHKLRQALGLPLNHTSYYVHIPEYTCSYDRTSNINYEYLNSVNIVDDNNKIECIIEVEKPFAQRYWSIPELVDIGNEVGFTDFMFQKMDYEEYGESHLIVPNHQYYEEGNTVNSCKPNRIMFIK